MADINNAIALQAKAPEFNPLETVGKLNSVKQGLLQNRLLDQEVSGKIARGKAFQTAIGPDGSFDEKKAMTALGADPDGAQYAGDFAQQVQAIEKARLEVGNTQIEQFGKKLDMGANMALGLLSNAKTQPITRDVFINAAKSQLISSGMFDDPASQQQLLDVAGQMGDDPAKNAEVLNAFIMRAKPTMEAINMTRGPVTSTDIGPAIVMKQASPLTGDTRTINTMQKDLDPATAGGGVEVYDPEVGGMVLKRRDEVLGGANGQSGGFAAAAPIGTPETATKGVEAAQALIAEADAVPEQKAAMMNMRDALKTFTPGPKADWTYAVNALATQLGVAPPKVATGVAGQEEFGKLATQFVNAQVGQLGGAGTDAKLESGRKGSPNEFMSREGIENVTSLMMGLMDAKTAKAQAWQKWSASGQGPQTWGKFSSDFNNYYNPRVFQSVYMTPEQKALMLKGMDEKQRTQFQKDWTFARKAGWIK